MKTLKTVTTNTKRATVCLIAGLLLIQVTIKASDSTGVKSNCSSKSEIAFATLNNEVVEAEYEIEDWMTDVYSYISVADTEEEEIEIEAWMSDINNSFWSDVNLEKDSEIAIESWMSDPQAWEFGSNENLLCSN